MAKKAEFVVYADFEWDEKQYKKGDVFTPPAGYSLDENYQEFRNINPRRGTLGIPFYYQIKTGEQRNDKTGKLEPIMDDRRVVLPLEEKGDAIPKGE